MDLLRYFVFGKEEKPVKKKVVKKENNYKEIPKDEQVIYSRRVNVAGISKYYDILNEIIEKGEERGIYPKFKGYTLKDFKKTTESVGEIDGVETNTIILEKYVFNGRDAIKVLLEGEHGKFHNIGSIPKKELEHILPYVGTKHLKVKGFFVGGTYRKYDKEENKLIDTVYDLGVELSIVIKD